jgi:subtilisin-like proprotein convertase family protein
MKTTKFLLALMFFSILSCSKNEDTPSQPIVSVFENNTVLNIPDATLDNGIIFYGMTESQIGVNREGIITNPSKVTLQIDMDSPFIGELAIALTSPDGKTCAIIKRIGVNTTNQIGDSSNFKTGEKLNFNSTFTTQIPFQSLASDQFVPGGNYKQEIGDFFYPSISNEGLDVFLMNKNIKGTWKLKIIDFMVGDLNKLNTWKLTFDEGATK